jgi:hypothetical protein
VTAFYLKFLLTGILFSLVTGALLLRFNRGAGDTPYTAFEIILYSLGLGPVLTVLILYYLMILIPGRSHFFYLSAVLLVFGSIAFFGYKGFVILGRRIKDFFRTLSSAWGSAGNGERLKHVFYWIFLLVLLSAFLYMFLGGTLQTRMEQHDALIYGNLGIYYYQKGQVPYQRVMHPTKDGFVFQGSQKPSFSLLLTWEMLLNGKKNNQTPEFDLFFRSISGYYGLLVLALLFLWLYRKNRYLPLLGLLAMLSGYRFVYMLLNYHLDSYRIFFLLISWIWLGYALKYRDRFSFIMLSLFSGLAAFTHLIGLAAALLNLLAFAIFCRYPLKERLLKSVSMGLIILACGNIHYLLEIVFGAAWGFVTYL